MPKNDIHAFNDTLEPRITPKQLAAMRGGSPSVSARMLRSFAAVTGHPLEPSLLVDEAAPNAMPTKETGVVVASPAALRMLNNYASATGIPI